MTIHKPQFNPCYSVETIEPDKVFFLGERETVWLRDLLSCSLAVLIDGDRNNDTIIDTIQPYLLQDQKFFQEA